MYAHASGFNWDEGLLVLAPIALVAGLLVWARRRESRGVANTTTNTKTKTPEQQRR